MPQAIWGARAAPSLTLRVGIWADIRYGNGFAWRMPSFLVVFREKIGFVRHILAMIWDMRYSRFACFATVDLVEQNGPLRPELNRLRLGRFSQ